MTLEIVLEGNGSSWQFVNLIQNINNFIDNNREETENNIEFIVDNDDSCTVYVNLSSANSVETALDSVDSIVRMFRDTLVDYEGAADDYDIEFT